jgi:single-strand DNA-binding protein
MRLDSSKICPRLDARRIHAVARAKHKAARRRAVFLAGALHIGYTWVFREILSKQAGNRMSVNKVILVGRLGRDPETRFTGGGQAVANFSLATDETYKDKNGERQKRTEWHKITVWGKQAEIAQQYLKKGSLVYVEGRIQTREWQDKEGQKRTSYDIVANNFRMLGGRADGAAAGASAGAAAHGGGFGGGRSADPDMEGAPAGEESGSHGPEISDEDIPF